MALYQLTDTDGTVDRMTFNTAGKSGRIGPTLAECRSYYGSSNSSWWNDSNNFLNMTETGVQQWKVPVTGVYEITAKGASGGYGGGSFYPSGPGSGATVKISLELEVGTVINIVCGQTSSTTMSTDSNGSGGGGGTWVYTGNKGGNGLIVVAGGGGGWGHGGYSNKKGLGLGASNNGKSRGVLSGAPLTWTGGSSATVYSSGTVDGGSDGYSVRGIGSGGRGIQTTSYGGGGGGAGWLSDGTDPATYRSSNGEGGSRWIGGKGKNGTTTGTSQGGFGGGAGGGGTGIGAGGGGGYTGGGAGNTWISVNAGGNTRNSWGAGGGGGSAWKGGPNTTDSHFSDTDTTTLIEVTGGSDGISMTSWNNLANSGYVIVEIISTGPPTGETPQVPPENAKVPIPTADITFLLLKQIYIKSGLTTASGHQALTTGGIYGFTTHTFTNCGKTGNTGPTLTDCISSYGSGNNWWNNTNLFNVIGKSGVNGIQVWTVPDNGYYEVDAYGARGGGIVGGVGAGGEAGLGARMKSRFYLTMGDKYMILCGQKGIEGEGTNLGSSGGGGTFFVKGDDYSTVTLAELQLAAGGGGGRGSVVHGALHGGSGQGVYSESTAGGAAGEYGAGGGGGLISNGVGDGTLWDPNFTGGYSFKNGGEGGTGGIYSGNNGASGGFGGGGGASYYSGSGGGGVYGGDGADQYYSNPNGLGGGSHNKGIFIEQTTGANNSDGKIIITATDASGSSRTVASSNIQLSYFRGIDFESGDKVPDDPLPLSINTHFKGKTFTAPGLYPFTSHTFTNCGSIGMDGPTLTECKNTYGPNIEPWNNTSYFNMVEAGVQKWTVPITGSYTIAAYGAEGGTGFHYNTTTNGKAGGKGAIITGTFNLTSGDILWIVVGQKGHTFGDGAGSGSTTYGHRPGGGGGGTYVVKASPANAEKSDILVIAGGGGGGRGRTSGIGQQFGGNGLTGETGPFTGPAGEGGTTSTTYYYGFSGAGFISGTNGNGRPGSSLTSNWAARYFDDYIPKSYKNGSRGGKVETWAIAQGGFGGGGGAGLVPGAGGGYSGGNTTGSWSSSGNAYGGGSKNNGTNQSSSATHTGHGKVIITFVS